MKPHSAALEPPPTRPEDTPYPRRWQLTREQVSWQTEVPGYEPKDFTAPEADPANDQAPNSHPNANPSPNPNPDSNPNPYPTLTPAPAPTPTPSPTPNQASGFCKKIADPVNLRLDGGELGGEELGRGTVDEYTEYLRRGAGAALGCEALNRAREKAGLGPL